MTDIPSFETINLLLRPVTLEDAPDLEAAFHHWDMVKYMSAAGTSWPRSDKAMLEYFSTKLIPDMERGQTIGLAIVEKQSHRAIGLIHIFPHSATGATDTWGFWIGQKWQKKGYMSEALIAITDYIFTTLRLPVIRHCCAEANTESGSIARKAGATLADMQEHEFVGGKGVLQTWVITPDAWSQSLLKKAERRTAEQNNRHSFLRKFRSWIFGPS